MSIFSKNYWLGNKEKFKQIPTQTPQSSAYLEHLLGQAKENTDFSGISNLARKNFAEQTIPTIAARFRSQGQNLGSSAYMGALSRSGSDLEAKLAALRGEYGLQQGRLGLTPQFHTYHQLEDHGLLGELGPAAIDVLKAYLTAGTSALGGQKTPTPGAKYDEMFGQNPAQNQFTGVPAQSPYAQDQGGTLGSRNYTGDNYMGGNTLLDLKQVSAPNERYAHLFDRNIPAWQQPGNSYGNNPMLKQLLSLLQNPGVNRNYPNY